MALGTLETQRVSEHGNCFIEHLKVYSHSDSYCYSHFTDENAEAQGRLVLCPRLHMSRKGKNLNLNLGQPDSKPDYFPLFPIPFAFPFAFA